MKTPRMLKKCLEVRAFVVIRLNWENWNGQFYVMSIYISTFYCTVWVFWYGVVWVDDRQLSIFRLARVGG